MKQRNTEIIKQQRFSQEDAKVEETPRELIKNAFSKFFNTK